MAKAIKGQGKEDKRPSQPLDPIQLTSMAIPKGGLKKSISVRL
jgi:hypothetical protein